jgi:uncharacterized repeat protein (TIGR02543 family)
MNTLMARYSKKSINSILSLALLVGLLSMLPGATEKANATCTTSIKVTFNFQGGTVTGLSSRKFSKTVGDCDGTFPVQIPTRAGYTFAGWLTQSSTSIGGTAIDGLESTTTSWTPTEAQLDSDTGYEWDPSFAVYANWMSVPYSVTYDFNGGVSDTSSAALPEQFSGNTFLVGSRINDSVITLPIPVKSGYTFAGWEYSGRTYALGTQFTMPSTAVTFTAVWSAITYNITFNGNGNTSGSAPPALTFTTGDTPTSISSSYNPNNLELTGYTFGGWSQQDTTTAVTSYGSPADVTLYAIWVGNTYNVSYALGSGVTGTIPASQIAQRVGSVIALPLTGDIARASFTHIGWTNGASFYGIGASYTVTSQNVIFSPVFTRNTVTITYNSNGATSGSAPANQSYEIGSGPLALRGNTGNLAKTGYLFIGWQETPTAASGVSLSNYTPTTGITLYARWEANAYLVLYDVATAGTQWFDWYQTGYTPITFRTPEKTGYTFAGFYSAKTGGVRLGNLSDNYATYTPSMACNNYNPCYTVAAWARWTPITYAISYNGNGATVGNVPANQSFTSGNAKTTLSGNTGSLEKPGYTFGGWATTSTGTLKITSYSSSANQTLYAIWKPISLKVIFYGNGGRVTTSSLTSSANTPIVLPTPIRTGYRSQGWFTATTGGTLIGQAGAQYVPTSAITLYPQWVRSS